MDSIQPINQPLPVVVHGKLFEALSKAQLEFTTPKKTKTVDFTFDGKRTFYKYADLADVIECIKGPLSKYGLSTFSVMKYDTNQFGLETTLGHSSGEKISTWYPLPDAKGMKAQLFGTALTYARRYSLSAIVGIASDDDTDDNPPPQQDSKEKPKQPQQPKPETSKGPTAAQLKRLYAIGSSMKWPSDSVKLYCFKKVKRTPGQLTQVQYEQFCTLLAEAPYDEAQAYEIRAWTENLTEDDYNILNKD